jgi:hypothetical protein
MVMLEFRRADPTGIPPDDNPATAVALAAPDRAILVLGTKMFGSSDVGFISLSDQLRRIGYRSNGHFGSTYRTVPSHGNTVVIGFDKVEIPAETCKKLDQFVKDTLGDLIYRKLLIVEEAGVRLTPDGMRNY